MFSGICHTGALRLHGGRFEHHPSKILVAAVIVGAQAWVQAASSRLWQTTYTYAHKANEPYVNLRALQ